MSTNISNGRQSLLLNPNLEQTQKAEVLIAQGNIVSVVFKKIGVSDYIYYQWRKECGGMRVNRAHRLKELEQENTHSKRLVADLSLDNSILKEPSRGHLKARPGNVRWFNRSARNLRSWQDGIVRY
jgi:hypothetical protein